MPGPYTFSTTINPGDSGQTTWANAIGQALNEADSAATPSVFIERDSAGRAKVADPSVASDIATKNYVDNADSFKAPLASPTFTGTPAAPTATAGTNTTQLATTAFVTGGIATAIGTAILKSLYTTKGDLAVATAASTPARLGVGSDNQVLTADSTQASGVKWATPSTIAAPVPVTSATATWFTPFQSVGSFTASWTTGTMVLAPMRLERSVQLDGLSMFQFATGVTGTAYICVYNDTGSFAPGTLNKATTAIAIAGPSLMTQTFTATTLSAGMYWVGVLLVFSAGSPSIRAASPFPLGWTTDLSLGTGANPRDPGGNPTTIALQTGLSTPPSTWAGSFPTNSTAPNITPWVPMRIKT